MDEPIIDLQSDHYFMGEALRLADGAGERRFAFVLMQFAAGRAPQAAVGFLRAFEQQHVVAPVEAVEQRGDLVRKYHRGVGSKWRISTRRFTRVPLDRCHARSTKARRPGPRDGEIATGAQRPD